MENNGNLNAFDGWDNSTEEDFFSIAEKEKKAEAPEEKKEEEETDKSEEEEDDLFSAFDEAEEVDAEEEQKNEKKSTPDSVNIKALNILKEKGLVEFELEEGEEMTEELADELFEIGFENRLEKEVQDRMSELPDKVKNIVKFALKGGDVDEYLSTISANENITLDIDIEKEENQIAVLKNLLKREDKDAEEIDAEIEFLKDSGKLETISKKKFDKFKQELQTREKELIEKQKLAVENEKKILKENKERLSIFLNELNDLNGLELTKEDKKVLPAYINDKTVKLNTGALITEMQKEIFYELPKNEKAMLQLATLLKNRNKDGTFNFDRISKKVEDKITKDIKDKLRHNKNNMPKAGAVRTENLKRSLAEYFD